MENVFQIVVDNYEPATDATEADFTPTTEEILQKVAKHTGKDDLSLEACYNYLKEHSFKTMDLGGLYFVWLLKSRSVLS